MTSTGDFIAMIDVLTELGNESDSLSADEAIAALEALGQLASEVKRCESLVTTALKIHLEDGSRQLGGRVYALGEEGKWRYRHAHIDRVVHHAAMQTGVDAETGEIVTETAVRHAIRLMAGLYRSASTVPKKGVLQDLGFDDTPDVADWEKTGKKIKVIDLEAPEGA